MVKLIKTKICSKRSCSQKYWIVKLIKTKSCSKRYWNNKLIKAENRSRKVVLRHTELLN